MTDLASDPGATPVRFAETMLGLPGEGKEIYPWQVKALMLSAMASGRTAPLVLGQPARRVKGSVCTPNMGGKDSIIIAAKALWWVYKHPRGKVVITSKSDLQISEQTIPAIERHRQKFEGWTSVRSPRYELMTPTGGKIIAFVTNHPGRVEGFHKEDDVDGPLLYIVNEAKSVDEDIMQAVDRCTYNELFYASSPGVMQGRFFESHSSLAGDFFAITAGLTDCPHIPKEKIDDIIKTYGENHPFTRSTLYGEFMAEDDLNRFVCNVDSYNRCIQNPPTHRPGFRVGFCDFADGGAENVFGTRDGNKIEVVAAWRERSPEAVAGKFIRLFAASGLKQEQIYGDAAGKKILDLLGMGGWHINRQNFGDTPRNKELYPSWVAEAWHEGAASLDRCEWILPAADSILKAQVTSRQKSLNAKGKLCLEDKHDLSKRNIESPDRADVVFGLMAVRDYSALTRQSIDLSMWRDEQDVHENSGVLTGMGASAGW